MFRPFLAKVFIKTTNIPILPEASLTFASKSCGPSHAANEIQIQIQKNMKRTKLKRPPLTGGA